MNVIELFADVNTMWVLVAAALVFFTPGISVTVKSLSTVLKRSKGQNR